ARPARSRSSPDVPRRTRARERATPAELYPGAERWLATPRQPHGDRRGHYRQIPSLRACVLVSHRERHIEVWRRRDNAGEWSRTGHRGGSMIELDAVGVSFTVDEVYRGVLADE